MKRQYEMNNNRTVGFDNCIIKVMILILILMLAISDKRLVHLQNLHILKVLPIGLGLILRVGIIRGALVGH